MVTAYPLTTRASGPSVLIIEKQQGQCASTRRAWHGAAVVAEGGASATRMETMGAAGGGSPRRRKPPLTRNPGTRKPVGLPTNRHRPTLSHTLPGAVYTHTARVPRTIRRVRRVRDGEGEQ